MFPPCYNVFMAIFNTHPTNKKSNQTRKGACFSVTMPFPVEKRLREIQRSMGLNSRSATLVFLVHHYDREQHAFDSIDKLSLMVDKMEKLSQKDSALLPEQQNLPYNNPN